MAVAFENFLFKKFRAVYLDGLSELATNINPLDVLIKKETQGQLPPRPVLKRCGPMFELGTTSSEEIQHRLRQVLTRFEETRGDPLLNWSHGPNIVIDNTSVDSLEGSLLGAGPLAEVRAHLSRNTSLKCTLEGFSTACVDKDELVDYVMQNRWKPDVSNTRLNWPPQPFFGRGGRNLWVVHQILYASKLVVTSGDAGPSGSSAGVSIVAGTPGSGVSVSRDSGPNILDVTVGTNSSFPAGKFKFAFRALCFQFNSAGELVGTMDDAGSVQPVVRGDDDGIYDDERAQIRDLFYESPPDVDSDSNSESDEEEEEREVHRLPIED